MWEEHKDFSHRMALELSYQWEMADRSTGDFSQGEGWDLACTEITSLVLLAILSAEIAAIPQASALC